MQYSKAIIAKAFFEQVKEAGVDSVTKLIEALEKFQTVVFKLKLHAVFKNPTLSLEETGRMLKEMCAALGIEPEFENILLVLVKIKALKNLNGIIAALAKLRQQHFKVTDAMCFSATPLTQEQLAQIVEMIKDISKCEKVILVEKHEKNLLGGVSLKVHDNLLDITLKNKLNTITKIIS